MSSYLRPRRGTLANAKSTLTTSAPLKSGEVFFECESIGAAQGKIKLGNGSSHYSSLPYFLSMQDSSIGFTNSTNSVSTADSSFLNSSILSTSAHSTVMYAVKQLLWNHTQKIAALNNDCSMSSSSRIVNYLKDKITTGQVTGTTTTTGALAIPSTLTTKVLIGATYHSTQGNQHIGFIFRRDLAYLTCLDNDLKAVQNKSVSVTCTWFGPSW